MKHLLRRRLLAVHHSQVCIQTSDLVDSIKAEDQSENVFSVISAFTTIFCMIAYITDVFSSAAVCYYLFYEHNVWWFVMTIVPQVLSLIVINGFSMRWYVHDLHQSELLFGNISKIHWIMRIFFHSILLGPVIRYVELFVYGLHSLEVKHPARESFKVMVLQEERDISMLSLVGSFIKSAPQLVLQLYILLQNKRMIHLSTAHAQEVSVVMSVLTLAMSMTSYHRALRRSTPSKLNMTLTGSALQFISYTCLIGCRVLALAAFASVYAYWFFLFLAIHWFFMISWLLTKRTSFCSTPNGERREFEEFLFNTIVAVIYVFCFLNVKDQPTRWKYTFYYVLICIQSIVLASLWYIRSDRELWFKLPLFMAIMIGLFFGLTVLGAYYKFFHPNKVSRVTTFIQVSS